MAHNMTGMPYTLLRLGYPEIGDEYYEIEYGNSTSIFGSGDIPPHKHIEPTFFEDDDFFELNFKNDKDEFEQLLENYTFYLHFTGRRWYGKLPGCSDEVEISSLNRFAEYSQLTWLLLLIQGICHGLRWM